MTEAITEAAEYRFVLKEKPIFNEAREMTGAEYYIGFEPLTEDLAIVGGGNLSFHFRERKSRDQAREIASVLNANIREVAYTMFPD